jgi:glycosyltransferase involved in cell wall biosynthesis
MNLASDKPFLLLMPSFNQAHYIADAVRSVFAQDDPDWQLWILDNSTDNTPEVMRQFADPRIHFHHIPERMDPGSCLNWMLERANGDHFSYLHTDNNLEPSYVRLFRTALQGKEVALAYCDMHVIDAQGRRTDLFHRGAFDLPRLLSFDTLGVPFAATTSLATRLGGFSTEDVADDVRFCVSAFGLAEFIYLREPMIEYRLHEASRTEAAGGYAGMRRAFLIALPKAVQSLERRGLEPRQAMAREIGQRLTDFENLAHSLWRDKLESYPVRWLGEFNLDQLFSEGVFTLQSMFPGAYSPSRPFIAWTADGRWTNPIRYALIRKHVGRNRELRRLVNRAVPILLPWAHVALGVPAGSTPRFRIRGLDFRTVWAARQLQAELGWIPLLDPAIDILPRWLKWGRARGSEPLLNCSGGVCFEYAGPVEERGVRNSTLP